MDDNNNIDFTKDTFEDIIAKDDRYHARAYAVLMDVVTFLMQGGKHVGGEEILEDFRDRVLDLYGCLAYTVLTEWGVHSCEDIGEMMFNLAEGRRIAKEESDTPESFAGGYDFKEAFVLPYEA